MSSTRILGESVTKKILIECKDFEVEAELLEDRRPETCDAIWKALPLEGEAKVWKEEVYFDIPTDIEAETPSPSADCGDVSYWPEGPAFCIFYGLSQPASPVNTFAKIEEGIEKFREVESGDEITVRRVE
ncbi:MAG: DUF3830 family protein [Hadesarchaea archaeon]|nr:DUF3830 family protein [Hadesarchaea archaeon]